MKVAPSFASKVVIVGDSGAGKTSLLTRLVQRQFDDRYHATLGADFFCKEIGVDGVKVSLSLWDTAGQERFRSLGNAFFRGADACVLVFDLQEPETLAHLPRWLSEFETQAGIGKVIVVVGNKNDKPNAKASIDDAKAHLETLATEEPTRRDILYFEASAKTGYNVDAIFEQLAQALVLSGSFVMANDSTPRHHAHSPPTSDFGKKYSNCCC